MNHKNDLALETKAVHSGENLFRFNGAITLPIFQNSSHEYGNESNYSDLKYPRLTNLPNHLVLHEKLASLENAEKALVTGSGMAAITTALLSVLSQGDHILIHKCLYSGTTAFLKEDGPALGIDFSFIDATKSGGWESQLKKNTRAIYVETISNPLMEVADLRAVAAFAKAHNLVTIVDNTFATPINFRPAEIGFDLSVHSGSKYLNGHSDLVCGAIIGKEKFIDKAYKKLTHFGGTLDPHACFLLHRSLKTLALRVERHNENALAVAKFLERHPAVAKVHYPGLESHAQHGLARDLFTGFGGMLGFELKNGVEAAENFLSRVKIATKALSLGGVETLVSRPAATSHLPMTIFERQAAGVTDGLIRASIGIENVQDLIADFEQAL